jgi:predicted O-methyltransferase YrrM
MTTSLQDPRAGAVLERLYALDRSQEKLFKARGRVGTVRHWLGIHRNAAESDLFLRDKLVALDSSKADLCYLLCRALNARRVVEFATSFGVSTIYLAAAVRDNVRTAGDAGIVIGTENEPTKVIAARANLAEAGLAEFVEIPEGDALETLKNIDGPVDFLLVDSWIPFARPIIELVGPQLRPGAIVVCDNVAQYKRAYRDYLDYIYDPVNCFRSMMLTDRGGLELSVRV